MAGGMYSLFQNLNSSKNSWAVKARVVRTYFQPKFNYPEELEKFEMILHDEQGDRIHASIRIDLYQDLKTDIQEGQVYKFKNFVVMDNKARTRTTSNEHKLYFLKNTHVVKYEESFPQLMYNFIDFEDIIMDRHLIHNVLLDVIGVVTSYQEPSHVAGTRRFDFKLADTEGKEIVCSLWGDYINLLLPILEEKEEKTAVVCIQFGKINDFYPNELKIQSTYHVTKVTVNGEDAVFKNFFERAFYWIEATIVDIVTTKNFWYLACKKCLKKVCVEGGIKKCLKCGEETLNDIYRYKLEVLVVDRTGSATLLLWNTHCYSLIGQTASQGDSNKSIPRIIEEKLIDKRVLFEVKLTAENNFKEIDHYLVNRLTFDDEIMVIHALKYNGSQETVTEDNDILSDGSRVSTTIEDSVKLDKNDKGKAKIDDMSNSEHSFEGDEMEHVNEEDPIPTTNAAQQNSQVGEHRSRKGIPNDPQATYTSKRKRTKKEKIDV
ncbi:hypothetical protein CASFOL_016453 [Castilleja foliolosa]|uniref:Replication factor A C-terminal domain-containing protein n=1 Tax=Castilleja foliolosa TaxID=1961234 RepID=A0ABD3DKT6_9LAMI